MGIVLDVRCDVLMLFCNRRLINGGRRQKICIAQNGCGVDHILLFLLPVHEQVDMLCMFTYGMHVGLQWKSHCFVQPLKG